MIKINLLPIRHEQKGIGLKVQAAIGGVVLLITLGICGYFLAEISSRVSDTEAQIARVKSEITRLQNIIGEIDKIKERKADLEKKLEVIQTLESGRLETVRVMDALSRATPPELWLTKVDYKAKTVNLTGSALDNAVIAKFIQNLNTTPGITGVVLSETTRANEAKVEVVKFTLRFNIAPKG
jgi:type IV pilus assembly protein PilN